MSERLFGFMEEGKRFRQGKTESVNGKFSPTSGVVNKLSYDFAHRFIAGYNEVDCRLRHNQGICL